MNKTVTIIVILLVVVLGGYYLLNNSAEDVVLDTDLPSVEEQGEAMENGEGEAMEEESSMEANVVVYTAEGYAPSSLTVKVGDMVTFKNESDQNMWTASAMHPTHIVYSDTSLSEHCPDEENVAFDACEGTPPGESWSFTFDKVGEWKYHDHLHPSLFGTIVVTE